MVVGALLILILMMQELLGVTGFVEKTQRTLMAKQVGSTQDLVSQKSSGVAKKFTSNSSKPGTNKAIINLCIDQKYFGSAAAASLARVSSSEELAQILFRSKHIQSLVNWRYLYFEVEGGDVLVLGEQENQEVRLSREDENGLLAELNLKKYLREQGFGEFHQLNFEMVAELFKARYKSVDKRLVQTFSDGHRELVLEEDSMGIVRIQGQMLGLKQYRCEI